MDVEKVVVLLSVTAAMIAGALTAYEPAETDDEPRDTRVTSVLTTLEYSEKITLETTDDNTFQVTCTLSHDDGLETHAWRTFPADATPPLEGYQTHWHIERNHTQTIPLDEARFPHAGEYFIDAACESWKSSEYARWTVYAKP